MIRVIAFLLSCSVCLAEVPWPISTAFTWEIPLWDGSAKVTGATVTCSIGKDTDANGVDDVWWTGSAWGSYTALSMTEETGNAHLSGKYKYTLSSAAVGSTSNVSIHFSSTYTSGITIWNLETLRTTLPTVSSGAVTAGTVSDKTGYSLSFSQTFSTSGSFGGLDAGGMQDFLDAMYDEPRSNHTDVGSYGEGVVMLDASTAALAKFITVDTGETEAADGSVASFGGGGGGATAAEILDAVLSGHTTAGTVGYVLQYIQSRLGSVHVLVTQPNVSGTTITLTRGDDYFDESAINISTTWSGASLVGGTAVFQLVSQSSGSTIFTSTDVTFTGGGSGDELAVSIEVSAAQTALLTQAAYGYKVVFTNAGKTLTPFRGVVTVQK